MTFKKNPALPKTKFDFNKSKQDISDKNLDRQNNAKTFSQTEEFKLLKENQSDEYKPSKSTQNLENKGIDDNFIKEENPLQRLQKLKNYKSNTKSIPKQSLKTTNIREQKELEAPKKDNFVIKIIKFVWLIFYFILLVIKEIFEIFKHFFKSRY